MSNDINISVKDFFSELSEKCKNPEDIYVANDGLWHCKKCNGYRQCRITLYGEVVTVFCACKCEMEAYYAKRRDPRKKEPPKEELLDYDF